MGFFSAVKKFFGGAPGETPQDSAIQAEGVADVSAISVSSEMGEPDRAPAATDSVLEFTAESAASVVQATSPVPSIPSVQLAPAAPSISDTVALTHGSAPQALHPPLENDAITLALRQAAPRLSAWLAVVLDGVEEADELFWQRLTFLLHALETPPVEAEAFVEDFRGWLKRMEYRWLEDFRSELQYRLALALDMEDEEDERDRLFLKLQSGLARTRARFGQGLATLLAGHGALSPQFWEELEELFIMADMGAEPASKLVAALQARAAKEGADSPDKLMPLLEQEVTALFRVPRRIVAVNPPEVILMVGVNGVGKTTTIAKLAYRARMQGRKVLIAAADTFRAAAVEQLQVWAERVGADFHAKGAGADPAAVAFEAMDMALAGGYDLVFIDTAGRLHTKTNLMEELHKIRNVIAKKHEGAPHRTILVIDATTGQNALQQTKMFKETSGVDEIILTKLDGTAKGGVALAVASQFEMPITFIGLGEKMEDLRPFNPHDFARALLSQDDN